MFVALEALVRAAGKVSLSLTMSGDDMVVVVVPQGKAKEVALQQPLVLTAPAAELDAGFVEAVQGYSSARKSLDEQVAVTTAILQTAEKTQAGKAQKALAGRAKPALPAPAAASSGEDDNEETEGDEESATGSQSGSPASAQSSTPADAKPSSGSDLFNLL